MSQDKIFSIPKIILHDHLDGGLRASTVINIASEQNIDLPYQNPKELSNWFYEEFSSKNFERCFKAFDLSCAVMQTEDAIERVAFEFAEDHALQNVIYAEARFCPYFHRIKGLSYNQIVESIIKGFKKAKKKYSIETGILVCGMYHLDDKINLELAKLCTEYNEVVGFDFAGMDINGSLSKTQKQTLEFLNKNNIKITAHSGEFSTIENIVDAVKSGATRIGHACNLFATEDQQLLENTIKLLIEKHIHIESNITSNIVLGFIESFEVHPFKKMFDKGMSIALNTDDRLMMKNLTITDEYTMAYQKTNLSLDDIVTMNINAAKAAFTDRQTKEKLIEKINLYITR
ncbi:adenosine deaminase [Allofrancisella guangzhouensis]|uniref:adenosine deaminase n=1 Tax=Allofrancisella guangzhouensis TaxID=594679 RepID=A0A0A8E569_9GAMM|nr:adenosine deaminase [Allofrancisella guangzhouensis]AJC49064.1 alkaline phosphatase [Allofrancisella guangzhouensis]MBK2026877.1 adenosine deaminase [Allofrancisella guangzhouensis]MBK2043735.1 adenosine deaminase [Allofrancisella guangzhouensis]MBK2046286.1 adenosine deaminase [Allofrancisella guangzhouensis]